MSQGLQDLTKQTPAFLLRKAILDSLPQCLSLDVLLGCHNLLSAMVCKAYPSNLAHHLYVKHLRCPPWRDRAWRLWPARSPTRTSTRQGCSLARRTRVASGAFRGRLIICFILTGCMEFEMNVLFCRTSSFLCIILGRRAVVITEDYTRERSRPRRDRGRARLRK